MGEHATRIGNLVWKLAEKKSLGRHRNSSQDNIK